MILVFGSVNVDMLFRLERLPGPGETVLCPGYERAPGGKGANQATAAAKAGGFVRFAGCIGADEHGGFMRRTLEAAGVATASLVEVADRPTGLAVIGVDARGENAIMVASGANLAVTAERVDKAALGPASVLLMQNEVPPAETARLARDARAAGARVVLNMAPAGPLDAASLEALDVLMVNEHELAMIAGEAGEPAALATALARAHGLAIIVTLGREGVLVVEREGGWHVPALAVDAVDTTGAGDCFAGVFAAGLDEGLDVEAAARRASVAAGLACQGLGAQAAQPDQAAIERAMAGLGPTTPLD